ncbi:hypothetical protein [Burkholderia sp. JP2-270]|uniref:hypothetical protein n=1 Tax=Burkholderia sp. JP2-270 TaxID=2217913 RepID=UPI0013A68E97|nr:hypothetical protein [Burkholderia sp. JP2-270]
MMVKDDILLRNYSTNMAIQLDPQRRRVWELLDGAHTQTQIAEKLRLDEEFGLGAAEIADLIATLEINGFLIRA